MRQAGEYWTAEQVDEMVALKERGLSYSQIAAQIGRSKNAVSGCMKRLREGVALRRPSGRPAPRTAYERNFGNGDPMEGWTNDQKRMMFWRRQKHGAMAALGKVTTDFAIGEGDA